MSNPLDEYIDGCNTEKTAGPFSAVADSARRAFSGKNLETLAWHSAAVGGMGTLVGAAEKARMAATKGQHHKKMLEVNPDLVEHQAADPRMFNQHYSSLRNMNPQFASDPVVAGSYMRRMSEYPHNAGGVLVEAGGHAHPGGGMKDFSGGLNIAQRAGHPPEKPQRPKSNDRPEDYPGDGDYQ